MPSITILKVPGKKDITLQNFNRITVGNRLPIWKAARIQLRGLEIDLSRVVSNAFDDYVVWASCIEQACTLSSEPRDALRRWLRQDMKGIAIGIPKNICRYNREA
jgi:hypothetical protein